MTWRQTVVFSIWLSMAALALAVGRALPADPLPPIQELTKFLVPGTDGKAIYSVLVTQGGRPVLLIGPSMDPWDLMPHGPQPTPVPPVPPDPVPPIPPEPKPVPPGPVPPVPVVGLNVAIIGPSPSAIRNLTPAQVAILSSRTLRDYLEKNCEKCEDGSTAYRGLLLSNGNGRLSARWQSILAKAPKDRFTLAAVKGQKAYFSVLPADTPATLKVLAEVSGVSAEPIAPQIRETPAIPDGDWEKYNPPPGPDGQRAAVVGEKRYLSLVPRDFSRNPAGSLGFAKPLAAYGIRTIPRTEWPARIAALKAAAAGLKHLTYAIPPYDQGQTNYCWVNCVCQGATAAAYEQGRPIYPLSPASVGGPLTRYRNVGGWPGDAMGFLGKTGAVGTALWPANAIQPSYASKADVKADYPKNLIVDSLADLSGSDIFDQVATCVLLGAPCPVAYNWWSHAVLAVGVDLDSSGKPILILRNSWGKSFGDNGFFTLPEGHGRNKGTPDQGQ